MYLIALFCLNCFIASAAHVYCELFFRDAGIKNHVTFHLTYFNCMFYMILFTVLFEIVKFVFSVGRLGCKKSLKITRHLQMKAPKQNLQTNAECLAGLTKTMAVLCEKMTEDE